MCASRRGASSHGRIYQVSARALVPHRWRRIPICFFFSPRTPPSFPCRFYVRSRRIGRDIRHRMHLGNGFQSYRDRDSKSARERKAISCGGTSIYSASLRARARVSLSRSGCLANYSHFPRVPRVEHDNANRSESSDRGGQRRCAVFIFQISYADRIFLIRRRASLRPGSPGNRRVNRGNE